MLAKAQKWSGSLPILASCASPAWIQGAFSQAGWAHCPPGPSPPWLGLLSWLVLLAWFWPFLPCLPFWRWPAWL